MSRSFVVMMALFVALAHAAGARAQTTPTLAELVAHIDDDPDPLHADFTPAVWAICTHELDGARAVLPLLDAADVDTRMHASRALSCAVSRWLGWRPGQGWVSGTGTEAGFLRIWRANGDYEWDADAAARHASRLAWERWLVSPSR